MTQSIRAMPNFTTKKLRRFPLRIDRITVTTKTAGPIKFPIPETCNVDEVVIGDWLHVEVLGHRVIWVRLGDRNFSVYVPTDPKEPIDVNDQEI